MKTDLIPRRTVLKGLGAVMALPWLEAMGLQTGWAAGNTPTKNAAPNRMAILYVPNGVNMDGWRVGCRRVAAFQTSPDPRAARQRPERFLGAHGPHGRQGPRQR